MPPNQRLFATEPSSWIEDVIDGGAPPPLRCAILGCGMMGQEHCSYIMGYPRDLRVDFLCDPFHPSIQKCIKILADGTTSSRLPVTLHDEQDLLEHVDEIDLLVIATPNYLHTQTLLRWGREDITILVEKPVAVSQEQHDRLTSFASSGDMKARVWVAMEYRYMPAIAKLIQLLPRIGDVKLLSIRENRYPFLHKIGSWNRDRAKTGDTLVEKCVHFFDLMRLITRQEAQLDQVRAMAQRGLNYDSEPELYDTPIIDSAYVLMPFSGPPSDDGTSTLPEDGPKKKQVKAMGCLELCMYAEGSRHQQEIIVTGTKGRLEAYLPENKVYYFERPSHDLWDDRSVPPPLNSIRQEVFDCSNVKDIHGIESDIPTHGGYHYSSTAIEWYKLLEAIRKRNETGIWNPEVSVHDGLRAVEIGLHATRAVEGECQGRRDNALEEISA